MDGEGKHAEREERRLKESRRKEKKYEIFNWALTFTDEHLYRDIRSLALYVLFPALSLSLLWILSLVCISLRFIHSFTLNHFCLTMRITLSLQTNISKKTKKTNEWELKRTATVRWKKQQQQPTAHIICGQFCMSMLMFV